MKRIIALLLTLALAASVTGCAQETPKVTSPNATATATSPTEATEPEEKEGVLTKDSYTVTDQEAFAQGATPIATIGEETLTNGLLQIYYWLGVRSFLDEVGADIQYYALDPSKALDRQYLPNGQGTWQQFFLDQALGTWHRHQATQIANGDRPLSPAYQEQLDAQREELEKTAQEAGFDSVEALVTHEFGAGCTPEDFYAFQTLYITYMDYEQELSDPTRVTDTDVEMYFDEHQEALEKRGITKQTLRYDVRHILLRPEGGTADSSGTVTWTEAQWEACRTEAQSLLDQWKAGEATEDSFAALAKAHSDDSTSRDNGGLYTGLTHSSSYVEPFKEWYLDESRQVGDAGLIRTDFGYHVMYLSRADILWMDYCRDILIDRYRTDSINAAVTAHEMTTTYEAIALAEVILVADK